MSQMGGYEPKHGNHKAMDPTAGNPHSIPKQSGHESAIGTLFEVLEDMRSEPDNKPKPNYMDRVQATGAVVHSGPTPFRGHG